MSSRSKLLRGIVYAGGLAALALIVYLAYLDRIITQTFDGRRWSVPAIVYAQPLEIYAGSSLTMSNVIEELDRLGYQQLARLEDPGSYKRTDRHLDIHLRAFQFMERARASQRIRVNFSRNGIGGITDQSGRPVPLIRLFFGRSVAADW